MKKKGIIGFSVILLVFSLAAASLWAADYLSDGAFAKFCEEANAAVDKNTDMFRDDLAFSIGALFPTESFLSAVRSSKPTLLSNLSSYKALRGSRETGLEEHVRNYDNMVVKRMEFFFKMADATGGEYRNEQQAIRRAMELWNKNYQNLQKMASNRKQSAAALNQLKKDFDDLKSRISSSSGPQALSSGNTLKNLFTTSSSNRLDWPPRKDQMGGLVLNSIYKLPWFRSSMELESDTKQSLEFWDSYVKKYLDPLQKRLEMFSAAMTKIHEQNKTCASLGANLQKGIEGDNNSENSLAFGLRGAMLDAAKFDQLLQNHVATELSRARKDYEVFLKFRDIPEVGELRRNAYSTYIDAYGQKDDRMLDAMRANGKVMREYRTKLRDIAK